MATAPALLSLSEYLNSSYHPDADFVSGILEERGVGEYEHGKIQGLLFHLFTLNARAWNVDPVVEQRIRIGHDVRVCDVAILREDAPRESVVTHPPLICIEVMSREDRLARAKQVPADYLALGVPNIWLVDPLRRSAFTFNATGLHDADPAALTVPNSPIRVNLNELFRTLDRKN